MGVWNTGDQVERERLGVVSSEMDVGPWLGTKPRGEIALDEPLGGQHVEGDQIAEDR